MKKLTRRQYLETIGIAGLASVMTPSFSFQDPQILRRAVPGTGEMIPCIGVGTWQTFDVSGAEHERTPLKEVLKTLVAKGGKVIDSSPMYGRSEEVVGDLSAELKLNEKLFIATKVWTTGRDSGIRQMNESLQLLRRQKIELMQIHNLTDWQTHIKTLRSWKEEGKITYIGLTHYTNSAHDRLISIAEKEPVDFLQFNYNLLDRHAEKTVLPFAKERGIAVLINQPFESGSLFTRVKGKQLPAWAKDFDCNSWAHFFLKYILSHPAVTCAIPGTSKPHHMLDNIGAAFGRMPDEKQRKDMIALIES